MAQGQSEEVWPQEDNEFFCCDREITALFIILGCFVVTHREEDILKQHIEITNSLEMKIESLEQEKGTVSATR